MRNPLILLCCLTAAQAVAQPPAAPAPAVSRVELRNCGIYASKAVSRESDAASASGRHNIVENELSQATQRIPLTAGVSFGCGVVMHGEPEGSEATFRAVVRVPGGSVLSGQKSYPVGREGFVGYTLRPGNNFVAGPWLLEIWVDGRKHADTTFTVSSPM